MSAPVQNTTAKSIFLHLLEAAVSLFVNGFGVFLTIRADIGAGPWDVFHLGLAHSLGILYGTASIGVSLFILGLDILLREPIGVAMFVDAVVVGKSVDFFNFIDVIPTPSSLPAKILMMIAGLFILGYTQFFYMRAALGCGPRDTLLIGIKRRLRNVPIGVVSVLLLSTATLSGYLLGGPVGIGTLICAFLTGPIMQLAFHTVHFNATDVTHQHIGTTFRTIFKKG